MTGGDEQPQRQDPAGGGKFPTAAWEHDVARLVDSTFTQPLLEAVGRLAVELRAAVMQRCQAAFLLGGDEAMQQLAELAARLRGVPEPWRGEESPRAEEKPQPKLRTDPPAQRDRRQL